MTAQPQPPLGVLVRKLAKRHPLSEADRRAILDLPHKVSAFDAHSYLIREGERPTRCAVILEGYAIRHRLTGEGARQILAIGIPGEAIDFQNLFVAQADHNVQMLTRGLVAEVQNDALEELVLTRQTVGRAVFAQILVEAAIFREWIVNNSRRDARTRIAHLLCEFAYRLKIPVNGTSPLFQLPVTQEQIADMTGLTPVHVNRVFRALEEDKLIERDRRLIRIRDWKKMSEAGDFDPLYLRDSVPS